MPSPTPSPSPTGQRPVSAGYTLEGQLAAAKDKLASFQKHIGDLKDQMKAGTLPRMSNGDWNREVVNKQAKLELDVTKLSDAVLKKAANALQKGKEGQKRMR